MTDISQLVHTAHTEKQMLRAARIADATEGYTSRDMRRALQEMHADGKFPCDYNPINPSYTIVMPGSSYVHRQ